MTQAIILIAVLVIGALIGYFIRLLLAKIKATSIEAKLEQRLAEVKDEAKKIILDAKEKASEAIESARAEEKSRKEEIRRLESRLHNQEEILNKKSNELKEKESDLNLKITKIQELKIDIEGIREKEIGNLQNIAQLSREQAREEMFKKIEEVSQKDLLISLQKLERGRHDEIEQKTKELIATVIQRYSRSNISEITTSSFTLPSEDLKGRIIGKGGRNIRHFEKLTGVELIIEDSPETITLSSHDPTRRAIAVLALEKLVQDGRFQPAKIEEKVEEAKREIHEKIRKAGEEAVYEVGILDLPKEIIYLLGRMAFRFSYGQNVLTHSIEVALFAGMLASELGLNVNVAKKAGLLHDIGKAVDHEIEGTHLEIGRRILQKYGVNEHVIKAMESHHETYPISVPEAYMVNAGDAISGARPGARRESLEQYIKRITELEKIALAFEGVVDAYAIQAGRELRVFVKPEEINDYQALKLARDVADRIESEIKFPGEIKVNVIRELRAVEFAR